MKKVRGKLYIHKSAISKLNSGLKSTTELALTHIASNEKWNIIRIDSSEKVGFLYYPKFWEDPHPSLQHSILVNTDSGETKFRNASEENPPILHRKETFLNPDDKNYHKYSKLTKQEEDAGLLDSVITHRIGFKKYWDELLEKKGLTIINHQLKSKT